MNSHTLFRRAPGLVAFPTPGRHPSMLYPDLIWPLHGLNYRPRYGLARWQDLNLKGGKAIAAISDASLTATGDLGWTLDYATAWLYRYLEQSRPIVSDAIDHLRAFDTVVPQHALYFFDQLDTKLFHGKLQGAVHLRWRPMPSCSPGTTSAPNVIPGIARVCIDLNKTPFINGEAQVDHLLEALIHHMIHAYFLICCGAQSEKDETPDDRLMDGLHFGVILTTIVDITKDCLHGKLHMIFHASKRRKIATPLCPHSISPNTLTFPIEPPPIALSHPQLPMTQTSCLADNRHITRQTISTWKLTSSTLSLPLSDLKGENVFDFDNTTKEFTEIKRIEGPPSATYVEVLWEGKRIMIDREKASRFAALKGVEEIVIPEGCGCDLETFGTLYEFVNRDGYIATPSSSTMMTGGPRTWLSDGGLPVRGEPPIWVHPRSSGDVCVGSADVGGSVVSHVKVFKVAERLDFAELMARALEQMNCVGVTVEDPIVLVREIYNDGVVPAGPVHEELRRWARRFLVRRIVGLSERSLALLPGALRRELLDGGRMNLGKIWEWHPREVVELYHRNVGFREDVDLARSMSLRGCEDSDDLMGGRMRRSVERVPKLLAARIESDLGGGRGRRRNGVLNSASGEMVAAGVWGLAGFIEHALDDEVDELGFRIDELRLLDASRGHGAGHRPSRAVMDVLDPLGLEHGHGRNILDLGEVALEI